MFRFNFWLYAVNHAANIAIIQRLNAIIANDQRLNDSEKKALLSAAHKKSQIH